MFRFILFLTILTSVQLISYAEEDVSQVFIEYDHFFTNSGHYEYANIGYQVGIYDNINLIYTFGFSTDFNQDNYFFHYPITLNVAPFWLLLGDELGITLTIISAIIPEGISFDIPIGKERDFIISPFIMPLTTEVVEKKDINENTISWAGSTGIIINKPIERFNLRGKIGIKLNGSTGDTGLNIGFGAGYIF